MLSDKETFWMKIPSHNVHNRRWDDCLKLWDKETLWINDINNNGWKFLLTTGTIADETTAGVPGQRLHAQPCSPSHSSAPAPEKAFPRNCPVWSDTVWDWSDTVWDWADTVCDWAERGEATRRFWGSARWSRLGARKGLTQIMIWIKNYKYRGGGDAKFMIWIKNYRGGGDYDYDYDLD